MNATRGTDRKTREGTLGVSAHAARIPYHELGLSHVPKGRRVVQAGKDILYARSRVAIFQPA